MLDSWIGGMKTTGRLALALVGATLLLVVAAPSPASAAAPQLTIGSPLNGSTMGSRTVSFTGNTNDASTTDPVKLTITGPHGAQTSAEALPAGETWSAESVQLPEDGTYTAVAAQTNLLIETGESPTVTFTIDTRPPTVTLQQPPSPSKNTAPSFTGTATDTTQVVVEIYAGAAISGAPVATATAGGTGGAWATGPASPSLSEGVYTAIATQSSSLGNESGVSSEVTFTVHTAAPVVTLAQPASPSKNTRPTFTGTASDSTPVVVHILDSHEHQVASATSTSHGASWTSGQASPALSTGSYSAFATEASSLGNPEGSSERVSFQVDTNPPTVTLDQPLTHSNNATPTFTGTASDTTQVTVKVYIGPKAVGSPIATATALPSGGAWKSGHATLPTGKNTYTAVASEESSLGNPPGASAPVTFAVDTEAPSVTLNAPASPMNVATPSFTGTASETNPVIVEIFRAGSTISGPPVATATAAGTGRGWATGPASPALADGEYVAVATQKSSFGHGPGSDGPAPFVVDTVAPAVTLSYPSGGSSSNGGTQAVAGTAGTAVGDFAQVTVQLFSGSQIPPGQSPTQSVQVPVGAGQWSVTLAGLGAGSYVVRAEQADDAGNVGATAAAGFSMLASSGPQTGPLASFSWSPSTPHVGETVSLLSSSTDAAAPITGFAWDLSGTGAFVSGGAVNGRSFSAPGKHLVQLRVTDANGASNVASATIAVADFGVRLMQPFPTVRIAASRSGAGISLKLLSVRASAGAHVLVSCSGKGCPAKSQSRVAAAHNANAPVEFRRFERFLRPGIVLAIRITKAGEIGKYTRLAVRRGRLPVRSDACVGSPTGKPFACPSS
jgi:hypothetical protein